MVGFGSSLRMSRRRGWEDAYLDYQSLRLLLMQIEAVYEEEDWKRGGGGGGTDNNNNTIDGNGDGGSAVDLFDDLDEDFEHGGGVATKTTSDGGGGVAGRHLEVRWFADPSGAFRRPGAAVDDRVLERAGNPWPGAL